MLQGLSCFPVERIGCKAVKHLSHPRSKIKRCRGMHGLTNKDHHDNYMSPLNGFRYTFLLPYTVWRLSSATRAAS